MGIKIFPYITTMSSSHSGISIIVPYINFIKCSPNLLLRVRSTPNIDGVLAKCHKRKCCGMKKHTKRNINNGWKGTDQRGYLGNGDEIRIKE